MIVNAQGNDVYFGNKVAVGKTSAPNSTLQVAGSLATAVTASARTGAVTASATEHAIEVNTTATQTLPALSGVQGREYLFVNVGASAGTIAAAASEVIGNVTTANTYSLPSGATVKVKAFPTAWRII